MNKATIKNWSFTFWNWVYDLCWKLHLYKICTRYLYRKVYNGLIGTEANGLTYVGPKM